MNRKILTFSCLPFSGSTFLGKELSGFGNITYLGETNRLRAFGDIDVICDNLCSDCHFLSKECEFWTDDFTKSLNHLDREAAFKQIIQRQQSRVIIDGSKIYESCTHHSMIYKGFGTDFDLATILLIRNPLDWAASFSFAVDQYQPEKYLNDAIQVWNTGFRAMLERIRIFNIPLLIVQTEHLWPSHVLYEQTMRRILGFVNLDLTDLSIPPSTTHQIGGNEIVLNLVSRDNEERTRDMSLLKEHFASTVLENHEILEVLEILGLKYDLC